MSANGQFINLDHPVRCRGNITAWHLCYYPDDSGSFRIWFRVWRPTADSNSFTRLHNDDRTITQIGSNRDLVCENVTLAADDYVQVESNDVIGVYIPSFTSTSVIGVYEAPQLGEGVYHDTRNSISPFLGSSVDRSDLTVVENAKLYLNADISKSYI